MKFDIKNRVITGEDCLIVGDNSNYIAEFTFDKEWNGVTKTARFISCNGSYVDVILKNDQCPIPCEVLKCGYCGVGVYSAEMTTTKHKFFVTKSVKDETGCVCEPTPDVYEQLLKKIDGIVISGGGTGTTDYNDLDNKPSINGIELNGNKTSEELGLGGAGGGAGVETDPTVPSHVKAIKESDIENWNNKSEFSGSYNDLADKPTIPTNISEFNNDKGYATTSEVENAVKDKASTAYVDNIAKSLAGQNEYIGSYAGSEYTAETIQTELSNFVIATTKPSREKRNGDIINIVNGVYGGQQWIYNGNEQVWKYYIDFENHSVIDSLTSDSSIDGLSARQGKLLKEYIDTLVGDINTALVSILGV